MLICKGYEVVRTLYENGKNCEREMVSVCARVGV